MRVKLVLSYDGTRFSGWQRQPNGRSIQETLETAISEITGEETKIIGSGRTDAGVHAEAQVAHFDTNSSVPVERFYKAINAKLPSDVKVLSSEAVKNDFDACRAAKKKTYRYLFYKSNVELPLFERYAQKLSDDVDIKKMQSAAELFKGRHNFKGFCASGTGAVTFEREIYEIKIQEKNEFLSVLVTGGGFLYKMVRMVVGALIAAGKGKIGEKEISEAFLRGEQIKGVTTLPAKGLTLVDVKYE